MIINYINTLRRIRVYAICEITSTGFLEISKRFFKDLRRMDEEKIDVILACGVSDVGLGFAVMNRMMKSAGYNIINLTEEHVGQKIDSRGENDTLPI